MNCLLILSLAVLGASAAPCGVTLNTGCGSCATALPGRTIYGQTAVVENPTTVFPSVIPSASVSQSCHCMRTSVRPQIRNEIITVPTIDRIVRVVPSPVVEAVSVSCGGNTRNFQVPTCGVSSGVVGGVVEGISGVSGLTGVSGLSGVSGLTGVSGLSGVSGISGVVSGVYPRVVEGVVGGAGFGGIISTGNVGCGCGSNIVV